MLTQQKISIFWFRRDLRLSDNTALNQALQGPFPVLPLFIFDSNILDMLESRQDARLTFIYDEVLKLYKQFSANGFTMLIKLGAPLEVFKLLCQEFNVAAVYTNRDYEPYAKERDQQLGSMLESRGSRLLDFKDQVIFDRNEILNGSGEAYKVFTPYSKKWLQKLYETQFPSTADSFSYKNFYLLKEAPEPPTLAALGFSRSSLPIPGRLPDTAIIRQYDQTRDFPGQEGTSRLGIHLRHGIISIRQLVQEALYLNQTFLKELIWRDFYMMILDHNPHVVQQAFKPAYDRIPWRNREDEFERWCQGRTGIPIVDAGMRQLNQTGFMHNRVRMITASFLTKNLLIDWRWGEAYFAGKLLDYELASNNGGWQWAAGSGVDAQPYFRVFNPLSQAKTYDRDYRYIRQWVPEWDTPAYPKPMVDLKESRATAIATYKKHLNG